MLGFIAFGSYARLFTMQPVDVRRERLVVALAQANENPEFLAAIREALPPQTAQAFDRFVTVAKDWK